MSVGENIRRYRKSRGMTQAQLAEAVGLGESLPSARAARTAQPFSERWEQPVNRHAPR